MAGTSKKKVTAKKRASKKPDDSTAIEPAEIDADLLEALTPKQIRFCREYIIDMNATKAYIRAGFEGKSAAQNASMQLRKHKIQELIARFAADRALRTQTEADQVVSQTARVAMGDIRKLFNSDGSLRRVEDLDDDTAAAVQSVKVSKRLSGETDAKGKPVYDEVVEYKMLNKLNALDLLGKHMKLWLGSEGGGGSGTAEALRDLARKLPD